MALFHYEKKDRGVWVFNKTLCPKGKIVSSAVAKDILGKDGWVDSVSAFMEVKQAEKPQDVSVLEEAVRKEKKTFREDFIELARNGKPVSYNEVYLQFSAKELEELLIQAGLSDGLDLRSGLEKIREKFNAIVKAHNDGAGAK